MHYRWHEALRVLTEKARGGAGHSKSGYLHLILAHMQWIIDGLASEHGDELSVHEFHAQSGEHCNKIVCPPALAQPAPMPRPTLTVHCARARTGKEAPEEPLRPS